MSDDEEIVELNKNNIRCNSIDDLAENDFDPDASENSDVSSSDSEDDLAEDGDNFVAASKIKDGFRLNLGQSNLKVLGIDFVIKFGRVFKAINEMN